MWQQLSQLLGWLSICTWLGAQLPQIFENWRLRSVDGLSLAFLCVWVTGDFTGLVGCVLTGQLGFQTVLACYYLAMDCVLCTQYWLYTQPIVFEGRELVERDNTNRKPNFRKRLGSLVSLASVMGRASAAPTMAMPQGGALTASAAASPLSFEGFDIGHFCAYTSTLMYIVSRIPQILRNRRRQSVAGVSPMLFTATLIGNLAYSSSILCASMVVPDQRAFLLNELSYILGSAGTVVFDVVILLQFWWYRPRPIRQPLVQARLSTRLEGQKPVLGYQTIYTHT